MTQKAIKRKTDRNKNTGKTVLIVSICVILIAVLTLSILVFLNRKTNSNSSNTSSTSTSTSNKDSSSETMDSSEETNPEEDEEAEKARARQYDGEDPNKLETLTGVISFAGVSEGKLRVNVTIDQLIGDSGKCNFTLTNSSGTTLSDEVSTENGPATSFCSYVTTASKLEAGTYKIVVKITSPNKEGEITGEVKI